MTWSADRISKTLASIQASVPVAWTKAAFKEVPASPTIAFVVDEALKSDKVTDEKKRQLQILKDSGEFSKVRTIEDTKVTKKIDEYIVREIKKAVRRGDLPPKSKAKDLPHVREILDKVQRKHD